MKPGLAWRARLGADPERQRREQRDAQPTTDVERVYQLLVLCGGDGLLTVEVVTARLVLDARNALILLRSLYEDGKVEPDPNTVLVLAAAHKRACAEGGGLVPRAETEALIGAIRELAAAHVDPVRRDAIGWLVHGLRADPRTPFDLERLWLAMEPA